MFLINDVLSIEKKYFQKASDNGFAKDMRC